MFPKDMKPDVDTNGNGRIDSSEQNAVRLNTKNGYDLDALLGYDFGRFRLEGEAAYKRANVHGITSTGSDINNGVVGAQTSGNTSGHAMVMSLMGDGLADPGPLYAGGGVGYGLGQGELHDCRGIQLVLQRPARRFRLAADCRRQGAGWHERRRRSEVSLLERR